MQKTVRRVRPKKQASFAHPVRNTALLGIGKGMHVADFGSGSGAYTLAIAALLQGTGRVWALDVQRDLLRRLHSEARNRGYHNVDVIWTDLESPGASKLADHALDLVLMSNLLFQLGDKIVALKEAHRILKPVGSLAIIEWADPAGNISHSDGVSRFGPHKDHHVSRVKVEELAAAAGFEFVREFDAGGHHYGLVFRVAQDI